jgi:DNA-binding MarR family transcriptional regulator
MRPIFANKYISILYRFSQRYFTQRLRGSGLEVGQLPFLLSLYRFPGLTQERLSATLGMDKGTTARSLAQLEKAGLVLRQCCKNDRRINHVYPTGRALDMQDDLFSVVEDLHDILYRGLSPQERQDVVRLLTHMAGNMDEHLKGQG